MKIEGYEEISEEEYRELPLGTGIFFSNYDEGIKQYFKKAQKFPIVFEDEPYEIEVDRISITILEKHDDFRAVFGYKGSFPLLVKAVEKAKEVSKLGK